MFIMRCGPPEKTDEVASLTAKILPASRSTRSALTVVGAGLRQLDHVQLSDNECLIQWPGLGAVLITELPGELMINIPDSPNATPVEVRAAISKQIRHAAGSRSVAAKLVTSWVVASPDDRTPTATSPQPTTQ